METFIDLLEAKYVLLTIMTICQYLKIINNIVGYCLQAIF